MPEDGPPYKRPRGKSPRGKKWDAQEGKWVNQRTAGAAGSSKDAVAVHGVGASTALVVCDGGADGGALTPGARGAAARSPRHETAHADTQTLVVLGDTRSLCALSARLPAPCSTSRGRRMR